MQLPSPDCRLCPRLAEFRDENQTKYPGWFHGAVPSFGPADARLLVVGLAPGLKGANKTGRPFTGDYAGDVLYPALLEGGFASGEYDARPDDTLVLKDCRITNAVRCVPPQNKPTPEEITTCRPFLLNELHGMPNVQVIMALGGISHRTVSASLGFKQSRFAFKHGAVHPMPENVIGRPLTLVDSYHCSRYNINTNRLTREMFAEVVAQAKALLA